MGCGTSGYLQWVGLYISGVLLTVFVLTHIGVVHYSGDLKGEGFTFANAADRMESPLYRFVVLGLLVTALLHGLVGTHRFIAGLGILGPHGLRVASMSLTAAGIVALTEMILRLADDHCHAKDLAEGLADVKGISLDPSSVMSNIVIFELTANMPPQEFLQRCGAEGVKFNNIGGQRFRMVSHYGIESEDIEGALGIVQRVLG